MILNGPFAARSPIVPQLFHKEKPGLNRLTQLIRLEPQILTVRKGVLRHE